MFLVQNLNVLPILQDALVTPVPQDIPYQILTINAVLLFHHAHLLIKIVAVKVVILDSL